jgi:predicted ATPase/DNA-binding SARP family transcriptional activator
VEVRLLGEVAFEAGGDTVTVRGAKQRILLTMLALQPGKVVSADRLAAAVWGDGGPTNPANALHAQISALRRMLPEGVLVTKGGGYVLAVDPEAVDVRRFERLVTEGRRLLASGQARAAAVQLREALGVWRGPVLGGLTYDEFIQPEIARLDELRLAALEGRIDADLAVGDHAGVVGELEALTGQHPLRERFWVQRMVALYRCGRQADSLRAYSKARRRLVDELGLEPGQELRRAEALVLAQDPSLDAPTRRPATSMSAPAPPPTAGNLRARLTRFVGRDADIEDVAAALRASRLVTLVGPGGAGKTRLAVETADRLAGEVADGVWLVELAGVGDAAGVGPAVAVALGVSDDVLLQPTDAPHATTVEQITRFLTGRAPLVILDNCEHVVVEAADVCERLLRQVPGLRIVATSREPLGVPGEILRVVAPLALDAAVELFADRARAVSARFQLDTDSEAAVADICRRLDGLPLAVELAAARLRALSIRDLTDRLGDRFRLLTGGARTALPRQQTLRAVVDWSYDLLFDDERRLFCRMSVFANGCRLDAAEFVCGDEQLPAADVLDVLARLVDKSLVLLDTDDDGQSRYRQLQTLSQYGLEKLAESGEAELLRARHAYWQLDQARGAEEGLRGATGPAWRRLLGAEFDDLRAALDWFVEHGDGRSACELTTGIAWMWFLRAEFHDALRWLGDALDSAGDVPAATRAVTEAWAAYYATIVTGSDANVATLRRAHQVVEAEGTVDQQGTVMLLLASTLIRLTRCSDALDLLARCEPLLAAIGHDWGLGMGWLLQANALARLGRLEEAIGPARNSVELLERIGEHWTLLEPMGLLAAIHDLRDDPETIAAYDRVVATSRRHELPSYLTLWLVWRGIAHLRRAQFAAALADFGEAADTSPNPSTTAAAMVGVSRTEARLREPSPDVNRLHRARELFAALGRRDGEAVAVVAEGLAALERGDLATATRLASDAERLDGSVAALLGAAIASHRGEAGLAAALLRAWADRHVPAIPGMVTGALAADHARLAAETVA